jgi:hypothetical protein
MGKRQNDVPENAARPNPSASGKQPEHEAVIPQLIHVCDGCENGLVRVAQCNRMFRLISYQSRCSSLPLLMQRNAILCSLYSFHTSCGSCCTNDDDDNDSKVVHIEKQHDLLGIFLWDLSIVVLITNP